MNRRRILGAGAAQLALAVAGYPIGAGAAAATEQRAGGVTTAPYGPGRDAHTDLGVGIILVGASWCAFCKSAAPVLAALVQGTGIPVLVASHDARPIPPFGDAVDARTHAVAAQIRTWPTTLIYAREVDTITGQITGYRNARHYAQSVKRAVLAAAGRTS